jgi:glycine cleavage system H protein
MVATDCKYTEQHEWARLEGDVVTVGITDYAQKQLGDITYVELPEVDDELTKSEEACSIESVKAAASVYAPAGGTVTEVNEALDDDPSLVNTDPQGDGWIFKMNVADPSALDEMLSADDYQKLLDSADA